jgi:hypothetical protein
MLDIVRRPLWAKGLECALDRSKKNAHKLLHGPIVLTKPVIKFVYAYSNFALD